MININTQKNILIQLVYAFIFAWMIFCVFSISLLYPINPDEREHLYATYLITQGQVPYIDFFEHHHPLLWYISAFPLLIFGEHAYIWYVLRIIQALILCFTSLYIYKIMLLLKVKHSGALLSVLIYLCFDIVRITGIEFRPDSLMVLFFVMGYYYFYSYLLKNIRKDLYLTYLCFFMSFLALQKSVILFVPQFIYIFVKSIRN